MKLLQLCPLSSFDRKNHHQNTVFMLSFVVLFIVLCTCTLRVYKLFDKYQVLTPEKAIPIQTIATSFIIIHVNYKETQPLKFHNFPGLQ